MNMATPIDSENFVDLGLEPPERKQQTSLRTTNYELQLFVGDVATDHPRGNHGLKHLHSADSVNGLIHGVCSGAPFQHFAEPIPAAHRYKKRCFEPQRALCFCSIVLDVIA